MQGWMELATGHIGNTSIEINHRMCNCIVNTWCILLNGVLILLWNVIWNLWYSHWGHLSGIPRSLLWPAKDSNLREGKKGCREEKEQGWEEQHAHHNERATHPVPALPLTDPDNAKTKSMTNKLELWWLIPASIGVGGNTFLGSSINQFSLLCCAI